MGGALGGLLGSPSSLYTPGRLPASGDMCAVTFDFLVVVMGRVGIQISKTQDGTDAVDDANMQTLINGADSLVKLSVQQTLFHHCRQQLDIAIACRLDGMGGNSDFINSMAVKIDTVIKGLDEAISKVRCWGQGMRDRVGPGHLAAMSCVQILVQKEGGAAVVSRAAFAERCAARGVDVTLVPGFLLDKLDE